MSMKSIARIICTPSCWVRNESTSRALSDFINDCLDSGMQPKSLDSYTCELGGVQLWIANYPFAFGRLDRPVGLKGMPDRVTVFRLADALGIGDSEREMRLFLAKATGEQP